MEQMIRIPFPDAWAVLPTGPEAPAMIEALSSAMAELGEEAQQSTRAYLEGLGDLLAMMGIDLFASLVVPSEVPDQNALAWCAMGITHVSGVGAEQLAELAADDPFGRLDDPEVSVIEGRAGLIGRSRHFRANPMLQDEDGSWPFSATVRYVIALDAGRLLVSHFETISLGYLDVLEEHFDALMTELRVD